MAFNRFRPSSHLIAPDSWMNDPCGAVYVPETKDYLLCYQWNPGTTEGGNSAWGMAKSKDMVTWQDCTPALRNGSSYDRRGVFSGSIVSRIIEGRRVLFLFYTSVSAVPIHWSKRYIPGCESQSVACSYDFGASWHRYENNPLLTATPKGDKATTGWRDPFVSRWEGLSRLLGKDSSTDYMLIASGEQGVGPQLHLYESDDLLDWKALATPFFSATVNSKVSPTSPLNYGINFECASFFTMNDRNYLIVGVEEDVDSKHHNGHYLLWLSGYLLLENGKPKFEVTSHGKLDNGINYAAHVFRDEAGRLLQLGWADEAAKKEAVTRQGWAGTLTHPRELYEVSRPATKSLKNSDLWNLNRGCGTMTSLGIRPARQLQNLRTSGRTLNLKQFPKMRSTNFELKATFRHLTGNEVFSFKVRKSPASEEYTKIIFDLPRGQITVDRSKSSLTKIGTSTPDSGIFELLQGEDLQIRIFLDNSLLEVFANDRFALTSRIYPSLDTSDGVSYYFSGSDDRPGNVDFECWEGLRNAWPARREPSPEVEILQSEVMDEKIGIKDLGSCLTCR